MSVEAINKKMWDMILALQHTSLGRKIVTAVYASGLVMLWNHFLYERDRKHPTPEMMNSKKFFMENKARVRHIVKLLEDQKSKSVFRRCIQYRITHDWRVRPSYNRKDQYFPKDIIKLSTKEVFVDCGAYNGDTIERFLKETHKQYKRIVAFEPDQKNIEALKKRGGGGIKLVVVPAACWSEETDVFFKAGGSSGSVDKIGHSEDVIKVHAQAVDNIVECKDATFIKMDIEGSEYDALLGAYQVIKQNRPTLAVCIYHSDEDMLRLIELIERWNLGYKFYIRHHAQKTAETVLYAISDVTKREAFDKG